MDNWWLELRPLLNILATHESVYEPETVANNAKDASEKVSA